MSTEDPLKDKVSEDAVDEVMLGDALGENEHLKSSLTAMEQIINNDGSGDWPTLEYLKCLWTLYGSPVIRQTKAAIEKAIKRFSDVESKRILARGLVKKEQTLAESEANINNAKADRIQAEADSIRASEKRKDKLLEYLTKKKIDVAAEERDGLLRIVFVKPDKEKEDEGIE